MNSNKIPGKLMGVAVGGTFISCETESTLNFDKDLLPASSVTSGEYAEFIQGKKNWNVSVNGILLKREAGADFKTLFMAWHLNTVLTVYFRTRLGVDQFLIWKGQAIVKSGMANAPKRGFANWNIVFQGNGVLEMDWEEFWTIINAMPAPSDQPNIVDTRQWGT